MSGKIAVTAPAQHEQIDGRRDAAAAISDYALVPCDALRREFRFCIGERDECLGLRVDQRRGGNIDTAGNAAGPSVTARLQSPVQLRVERVDDDGVAIGGGSKDVVLADEISWSWVRGKRRRRIAFRGAGLERAALGLPFVEAAVEHGRVLKAQRLKHPPESGRPHGRADRIQNHTAARSNAVPAEGGLEPGDLWHHEVKRRVRLRELALQIEKIHTRNVAGLERMLAGHGDIGNATAFGLVFEIGGAIEQPKLRLAEHAGEFRGGDEPVVTCHRPSSLTCRYGMPSSMKGIRPGKASPLISRIEVQYSGYAACAGGPGALVVEY